MMSNLAFVIPFYNHHQKIFELISTLWRYRRPIIIVDDGSDEISKSVLRDLLPRFGAQFVDMNENLRLDTPCLIILTHTKNMGKGAAVKSGAIFAARHKYSHIFQLDADMQHDLSQIPSLIALSKSNPKALICGYGIYSDDAPKARLWGRKITNFWIKINSLGGDFKDAMTGFRIYPLNLDLFLSTKGNRMEFDIEILLLFYRANVPILWHGVGVRYDSQSHFRGLLDNALIAMMHARLFCKLPYEIVKRTKNKR